jgi:hypothetical protein
MIDSFDEIIYVDWNSKKEKGTLIDKIKNNLIKSSKIRHITIEPDEAFKLSNDPNAQPCCEVLARNIAIRRSTGDWIVSTNIDIVPQTDLNFENFDKNTFYTVSRKLFMDTGIYAKSKRLEFGNNIDIKTMFLEDSKKFFENIPYNDTLKLREEFKKLNLPHKSRTDDISLVDCCGDFQIAHKNVWHTIRGFEESMIYRGGTDSNVQLKSKSYNFNLKLLMPWELEIYHIGHLAFGEDGGGKETVKRNSGFGPSRTSNKETWGFSHLTFKEEII